MIDLLNTPLDVKSEHKEDVLEITLNEGRILLDKFHPFNKRFIEGVKRGKGFKDGCVKEPATVKAYTALSKKFNINTAYDIGCQNLYTTLLMQKIFNCTVTGFDLDKDALEAGYENLKFNSNRKIKIVEKGIGVEPGYLSLNSLEPVDLIMIDVEGYQSKILADGISFVEKNKPIFVYETDNDNAIFFSKPDKKILQPLEDLGYKFFFCDDHRKYETKFKNVKCKDIPVRDGLLVLIPEDKL